MFVIPAGFEPTTRSLEGCCSIQLSYETNCFCLAGAKVVNLSLIKTRKRKKDGLVNKNLLTRPSFIYCVSLSNGFCIRHHHRHCDVVGNHRLRRLRDEDNRHLPDLQSLGVLF